MTICGTKAGGRKRQTLLAAAALTLASSAAAQTTPSSGNDAGIVDSRAANAAVNAPAASTSSTAPRNGLEEVVVTANRRASTVKDVPSSISAYSGSKLANEQIVNLNDLATISPNIQIGRTEGPNANVTIRGIGNTQFSAGSDPGVAFSVDGVYFAQTGLTASTLLDVDRVEVLRGPQGTLFGRNATGGAINILPNTPTSALHYGVDATVAGDPTQVRTSAFVSGPLTEGGTLLGRIAVQQTYNGGFSRNLAATGPRRLDGQNNQSARAQVTWKPTDRLTSRLSFEYAHENDSGPAVYFVGTPDPTQPLPAAIRGAPVGNERTRQTYANQGLDRQEVGTLTLTTDWQVLGGNLKSIISGQRSSASTDQDGDGTPVQFTDTANHQGARQTHAELLFASDVKKRFSYIIGANYFYGKIDQLFTVPISYLPIPVILGGVVNTHSYAGFAHAQYRIIEALTVFGGLRFTEDKKNESELNNFAGTLSQAANFNKLTYEGGVSYALTPAVTAYAKYATGYKSGGFSAGALQPAFRPESDANLEGGIKGSYFGQRLQLNLSAFHTKYSDLQVNQVVGVTIAVTNAARATIDGVEAETVALLTPALRLEISGAYLHATFNSFMTQDSARPSLGLLSLAGNTLPQAPRGTLSAGAYYQLPVSIPGKLTLGGRFDWTSRVYFSEFNLPVSSQSAIGKGMLDLRYTSDNTHLTLELYARNFTNAAVRNNVTIVSAILGSLALSTLQPGREVGLSVGYRF